MSDIAHYTIEPLTLDAQKQVRVRPGARKWNLAQPSLESVTNNPITIATGSEVFTAVAVLRHRDIPQNNYYLEDPNTPHGWDVLDCSDYPGSEPSISADRYSWLNPSTIAVPATPAAEKRQIIYEVWETDDGKPEERLVHLKHDCTKWTFGEDATPDKIFKNSGTYRQHEEVKIAAIAYVPVLVNDAVEEWGFYMDALAVGDYRLTGRVRYTMGFRWDDCTVGPAPQPSLSSDLPDDPMAAVEPPQAVPEPEPVPTTIPDQFDAWQTTYEPFPDGPARFVTTDQVSVRNLAIDNASAVQVPPGKAWMYAGKFVKADKDGNPVIYYRRTLSVQWGDWTGVPRAYLEPYTEESYEDIVINAPVREKIVGNPPRLIPAEEQLPWEKYLVTPIARSYAVARVKLKQKLKEKIQ